MKGKQLKELIRIFVEERSIERGLSPKTIQNKRQLFARFFVFLDGLDFSKETVLSYMKHLLDTGWSADSRKTELRNLRSFGAFLEKEELIVNNFVKLIDYPKVPKKVRQFVSEANAERIIIAGCSLKKTENKDAHFIKHEMQVSMRLILRSGLRISEAINLRGEDLHLDEEVPVFYVHSKGGDYEPLPVPRDMVDELRKRRDCDKVFQITQAGCNRAIKRGCEALGMPKITVHSLRHIFSLTRLRRGEALQLVSRTLRHSSIKITDDYYSNYVVDDLDPTIQNSSLIVDGIPKEQLFSRIIKAIERTEIDNDKRVKIKYEKSEKQLLIKVSL